MFELHTEITLKLRLVFSDHCDVFLLRQNYVISMFALFMFFDDVRITLYFITFELHTEIKLENGHFLVTFVCNQKNDKKIRNYYVICQLGHFVTNV